MLTLEQIRAALQDRMPSKVARATGLHYNTIRDIRNNPKTNPAYTSFKALSDYLEEQDNSVKQADSRDTQND